MSIETVQRSNNRKLNLLVAILSCTPLEVSPASMDQDGHEEGGVKEGDRGVETGGETPSQSLDPVCGVVLIMYEKDQLRVRQTQGRPVHTGFLAQAHQPLVKSLLLMKLHSCQHPRRPLQQCEPSHLTRAWFE